MTRITERMDRRPLPRRKSASVMRTTFGAQIGRQLRRCGVLRASLGYQPGGFAAGSASMPSTNVNAQAVATSVRYSSFALSTQPASTTKSSRC